MFQTTNVQTGTAAHTFEQNPLNSGAQIPGLQNLWFLVKIQCAPIRPLLFYTQIHNTCSFKMVNLNTKMTLYNCMALNVFSVLSIFIFE